MANLSVVFKYEFYNGDLMALLEPGTYQVGDNRWFDSCTHQYVIHNPIRVDVFQVTVNSFAQFVQSGEYFNNRNWSEGMETRTNGGDIILRRINYHSNRKQEPVTNVTWYEAAAYAKWRGKRLLKEKEWEIAARGSLSPKRVTKWIEVCENLTKYNSGIGRLIPESFSNIGCAFMLNLVNEWCEDWYSLLNYTIYRDRTDENHTEVYRYTLRQQSMNQYHDQQKKCRRGAEKGIVPPRGTSWVARRQAMHPGEYDPKSGFRCCRDIEQL